VTDELSATGLRKYDHIRINLEEGVRARDTTTGFERYRFVHSALPELDLDEIDSSVTVFGRRLGAPILVSSMTGGVDRGWEITRSLAVAAEELRCAIGVGSQRAAIENSALARYYAVRDVAPNVLLFANLGAVQLNYGFGVEECRRVVEMIGADALILHLNPLQEALQPEGNRDFSGLLRKISDICSSLEVPVVVKEVGFGISADVARLLASAGVRAIDVSGAGGTSWSAVEHYRARTAHYSRLSETFIDWGIPTAESLCMVRAALPSMTLFASGGLETGLVAAKAVALGADLAGFAGPMLRAAAAGESDAVAALRVLVDEFRLSMFATGSRTVADLRQQATLAPVQ
jgi:isopentenyl-diphosphate Delta-isomerase